MNKNTNKIIKKVAFALCISLLSMVEIAHGAEKLQRPNKFDVENGIIGVQRDIFFQLTKKVAEMETKKSAKEKKFRICMGLVEKP